MDLIESEIANINGSKAYFWKKEGNPENFNFYDYVPQEVERHLVIEGGVEHEFKSLIKPDVRGLSIISKGAIDLFSIMELIPRVEVLYIQCNSISRTDVLYDFEKLEHFSLTSTKNQIANFRLPKQLKSFVCTWKDKFEFNNFSNSLEYLFIEKARKLDVKNLTMASKNLIKLELIDCNLANGINEIINLKYLRYLSIVNGTELGISSGENLNTSVKYIYICKTKVKELAWIQKFSVIEVLILEDCGDINTTMKSLTNTGTLRGLWLAGNTKLIDGDLSPLNTLVKLENLFIRDYPHYTHRSLIPWSWKRFGISNGVKLHEEK